MNDELVDKLIAAVEAGLCDVQPSLYRLFKDYGVSEALDIRLEISVNDCNQDQTSSQEKFSSVLACCCIR